MTVNTPTTIKPPLLKRVRHVLEAAFAFALLGLLRLCGLRIATAFGGALGRVIGRFAPTDRLAKRNMARALPALTPAQRHTARRAMWRGLGYNLGEFVHYDRIWSEIDSRMRFVNAHHATDTKGRAAIFFSGHFANFELMQAALNALLGDCGNLYRAANNPIMDRYILRKRAPFMPLQINKGKEGSRDIIRLLKRDIPVSFLIDQKLTLGVETVFFGRRIMAPAGAAKMARRFNCPLVPLVIRRKPQNGDPTHFEVEFYPPLALPRTDNMTRDISQTVQAMNDFIAARIIERPHEWFWVHNRWKHSPD